MANDDTNLPADDPKSQLYRLYGVFKLAVGFLGIKHPDLPQATPYGKRVLRSMKHRIHDGYSCDDLLAVARYASERRQSGDRFPQLRNMLFLWGQNMPWLLACSHDASTPFQFRSGPARTAWSEQAQAVARRSIGYPSSD